MANQQCWKYPPPKKTFKNLATLAAEIFWDKGELLFVLKWWTLFMHNLDVARLLCLACVTGFVLCQGIFLRYCISQSKNLLNLPRITSQVIFWWSATYSGKLGLSNTCLKGRRFSVEATHWAAVVRYTSHHNALKFWVELIYHASGHYFSMFLPNQLDAESLGGIL